MAIGIQKMLLCVYRNVVIRGSILYTHPQKQITELILSLNRICTITETQLQIFSHALQIKLARVFEDHIASVHYLDAFMLFF